MSNRRDLALLNEDERVAALVTITPMSLDGRDVADDARDTLAEHFETAGVPVEVGRDE